MKVQLNKGLVGIDGEELKNEKGEPAVLRGIYIEALLGMYKDEERLSGEDKLHRWELALKIKNAGDDVEMSTEDVGLLKKLVGKAFVTMISGQAWQALEG